MSDKRDPDARGEHDNTLLAPGAGYMNYAEPDIDVEREIEDPAHTPPEIPKKDIGRTPWQIFWRQFRRDRWALAGIAMIFLMLMLAIFAPVISNVSGHTANNVNLDALDDFGLPGAPSWWPCPEGAGQSTTDPTTGSVTVVSGCEAQASYLLGVDDAGRDLFVRIAYGARTSLFIAFFATGLALVIGVILGVIAGFFRGKVDTFISRMTDVVLSLPILLLALGLASACGASKEGCLGGLIKPGLFMVSLIIGLFSWPYISRIIRGQVLSLREKEFVEASRSLGSSNWRIMAREILPNVAAPLIVYTTLIIPANILFEAGLSFLGVGVPDTTPSWGQMLSTSSNAFTYAPWLMIFPGLALFATTLAFNLVGDGMRDALDPRTTA